jgi:ABC-type transport system substrate-binding protein
MGGPWQPMLAHSWDVCPEATYWIFYLEENVYFHNGQKFTARDVVFTYQMLLDMVDTSPVTLAVLPVLDSVEMIDEYTVKIGFSEPFPMAGNGFRSIYIIPHEAGERLGEDFWLDRHSYGTGPWVIEEWIDGQHTRFSKNPNYWGKDDFDSYFEEVIMVHSTEPASIVAAQLAGSIDVYAPLGGIDNDMLAQYAAHSDRFRLHTVETTMNLHMTWQHQNTPFADYNARRAFNHSINRQLLIDTVVGRGVFPTTYFHPGIPGSDPSIDPYQYDPDLARQFLAMSSYDGSPLEIMVTSGIPKPEETALAIADMASRVGFNMTVRVEDGTTFTTRRNASDYGLLIGQIAFPNAVPARFVNTMLNDTSRTNFDDEELKEMIRGFNMALTDEARLPFTTAINKRMSETLSPHFALVYVVAVSPVAHGVTLDFYPDGMLNYMRVNYDPSIIP